MAAQPFDGRSVVGVERRLLRLVQKSSIEVVRDVLTDAAMPTVHLAEVVGHDARREVA